MGFLDRWKKNKGAPPQQQKTAPETEEYTPGGSAVYRYQTPENQGFRPPEEMGAAMEAIEKHIDGVFPGWEGFVYHEILSDLVHIDVHILRSPKGDCQLLFTTGMSDLPTRSSTCSSPGTGIWADRETAAGTCPMSASGPSGC